MSIAKFTPGLPAVQKATKGADAARFDPSGAVDRAMVKITLDEIAKASGCSVSTLRQSRMAPDAVGHRSPPAGLQRALHELCKDRAKYFTDLAEQLRPPEE